MSELLNIDNQHLLTNSIIHSVDLAYRVMAEDAGRPHVLMRPSINNDGNQWCALYGANLQEGVAGFGESPYLAMQDFDRAWHEKLSDRAA